MKVLKTHLTLILPLIAASGLLTACGGSSPASAVFASTAVNTFQCGLGTVNLNGVNCVAAGTIQSECFLSGGTLAPGGTLCRFDFDALAGMVLVPFGQSTGSSVDYTNSPMPIINPSLPTGYNTYIFGSVLPNDTVTFQGNGSWSNGVKTFIGLIPTGCKSPLANEDGLDPSLNLVTNEGVPAGTMVSNGIEAHYVGENGSVVFGSAGALEVGFNAPFSEGVCSHLNITELHVARCADVSGQLTVCP